MAKAVKQIVGVLSGETHGALRRPSEGLRRRVTFPDSIATFHQMLTKRFCVVIGGVADHLGSNSQPAATAWKASRPVVGSSTKRARLRVPGSSPARLGKKGNMRNAYGFAAVLE